jgi:hypothetical protein
MRIGGRALLLSLLLLGGAAAEAADLAKAEVIGIRLRSTHPEVIAALARLGADEPIENVTCPAEVTGVCLREMSVTIGSAQRRELMAIQFIEDAEHKTREVYDLRYRDLPLQRETADDFLRHAQSKFGPADLALTNGSFYWGAVLEKGSGRDRVDQAKPFIMVDPIQRIVQLSDPSFFAAKRAELAAAARDAARKATEQTIPPRF